MLVKEQFMSVTIDSAGDHSFDLVHLRRSGGEELIQLLLNKAGYGSPVEWQVRVNKKQHCSGMTPPVSVIRYNEWGIYVRIKPGDNNTCHNITILVPKGYVACEIYKKIKTVEKLFNRNWRKADMVDVNGEFDVPEALVEVSDSVIDQTIEDVKIKFNVAQFLTNNDNLKAICLTVLTLSNTRYRNNAQFMADFSKHLNIKMEGRQAGAMMRSVVHRDLLRKVYDGGRHAGYALTKKGMSLIQEDLEVQQQLPVVDVPKPKSPVVSIDRSKLLRDLGPIAEDISHASARIKAIEKEREELKNKLALLDKEEQELCELLDSDQISGFLDRLSNVNKLN